MKKLSIVLFMLCVPVTVWGLGMEPIPEEGGLSGSIGVGATWMKVKTNSFAGTNFKTLGSKKNSNVLSSPDSEDGVSPMFNLDLKYTFADSRMQLFLGGEMMDWFQFDMTNVLGVRKELEDKSILEGAVLFNAMNPEVWTDPFVTGRNRDETDRESTGGRIAWGRMFGTGLQVSYSMRDIDIDKERSGESLAITAAQRGMLDRNGDHHRGELMYVHQMNDNNWIAPTLRFDHYDLDGEAMANDRYGVGLTHIYDAKDFKVVTNLSYATADFDKRHPVYSKTRDDDQYGIGTTLIWSNFLNKENLTGNIGVAYLVQDSNISFYDDEILAVSVGTTYHF